MKAADFKVGEVVNDSKLTEWHIVSDLKIRVARELVLEMAPLTKVGPDGKELTELRPDGLFLNESWLDLAAVVIIVDPAACEVHAVVRHGPVFRLIRLRTE